MPLSLAFYCLQHRAFMLPIWNYRKTKNHAASCLWQVQQHICIVHNIQTDNERQQQPQPQKRNASRSIVKCTWNICGISVFMIAALRAQSESTHNIKPFAISSDFSWLHWNWVGRLLLYSMPLPLVLFCCVLLLLCALHVVHYFSWWLLLLLFAPLFAFVPLVFRLTI